jgi:ketosteroid isomerase-like protein
MSRENVEIVRLAGEAFNRRDSASLAEISDEDLEFVSVLAAVDADSAAFRGPGTWARYFAAMDEAWDGWRIENLEVFDAGDDRAAARFHLVGKGKQSGVPVDHAVGVAYRFRKGKLWRMRTYADPADALEAVGLRESPGRWPRRTWSWCGRSTWPGSAAITAPPSGRTQRSSTRLRTVLRPEPGRGWLAWPKAHAIG